MGAKKIVVKQVRGTIRRHNRQQKTLECLGLGRVGRSREHDPNPSTLGMLRSVSHLVEVREVS